MKKHFLLFALVLLAANASFAGGGDSSDAHYIGELYGGNYVNSSAYGTGTFSDWYLPAIDELNLMNNARYILNKNIQLS
jgi:hypothetical protein